LGQRLIDLLRSDLSMLEWTAAGSGPRRCAPARLGTGGYEGRLEDGLYEARL